MAVGVFGTALDAITWAGIDSANDMLTVCDANGDDLGTGPEDKRIAMVELIKRTLASADVSWMSSISVASLDHATTDLDRFLVFDASGPSIKVVTAAGLLNNTFAGASVSGITTLTLAGTDVTADYFLVWDNSVPGWRRMLVSELTNRLLAITTTNHTSTPTTVTTAQSGARLTNHGATQVIEFDLPAGATGLRYSFLRSAAYAIRLDPNGSEIIGDGDAGKYLEVNARGQVDIEWLNGQWEVVGGDSLYSFEV